MKIGIITFQRAYSYGAKLQAYALSQYLCSIGYDAEVIDYSDIGWSNVPGINFKSIKNFITSSISFLNSFRREKVRRSKFDSFFLQKIPHSSTRYPDADSLNGIENRYDMFIAGSDQVWCPKYNQGDMNFLLAFVKDNRKKFSYAASFGVSKIEDKYRESYKKNLTSFNRIMVRETEGAEIVKSLTGRSSDVVLDPTFLLPLDEWNKIACYPFKIEFNYILCFKILSVSSMYQKLIAHLKKVTGYAIVVLDSAYRYKPIKGRLYAKAGPEEFLGLIKAAKIVVTNSFHATAFSIIYKKDFYTVMNDNDLNSMMIDLTAKLNLSGRIISSNSEFPRLEDIKIDYNPATEKLFAEINKSKELLDEILKQQ